MNMSLISSLAGCTLIAALSCGAALAGPVVHERAQMGKAVLHSATQATCAAGFKANPAHINPMVHNGQHYTCTGPTIVCSPGFTAQETQTYPPGGGFKPIMGSPVTISNGHMVYTCAEPPAPPR